MFLSTDQILTPRCRIDPLQMSDAPSLQAITDASVTSRIHFLPEPFTLADARTLIAGAGMKDCYFAVRERQEGGLLGVIGAHLLPGRRLEVGYWFAAAARGRGLASEALRAIVGYLASRHPDRRIVAECHPDNGRSWALLERVGFVPTGTAGSRPGRRLLSRPAMDCCRIDVC